MQYTKYGRTPNQFTRGVHEHGLLRFQCYVNSASSPQFHLPMPTCHQFEHTHVQLAANMPEWAYKQGFIHQVVNTYQVCRCTYRWTSFECIQFCLLGCSIHQLLFSSSSASSTSCCLLLSIPPGRYPAGFSDLQHSYPAKSNLERKQVMDWLAGREIFEHSFFEQYRQSFQLLEYQMVGGCADTNLSKQAQPHMH